MHEFKVGDDVKIKDSVIKELGIDSCMIFNGVRRIEDTRTNTVLIGNWWYPHRQLELVLGCITKHVPFRHKFSKINYRNQ